MCFKCLSIHPGTTDVNDFQQVVNETIVLRSSTAGSDSCFRIVIMDDSDPEQAENFTINFVVSKVQPDGVNISVNQSEAVITIQENDRKCQWCSSGFCVGTVNTYTSPSIQLSII